MSRRNTPASLAAVDLNLLLVLDALLAEGSVTTAAAKIGLSQSATSHALTRIRSLLGDPILVRAGRSMTPTPRGRAIASSIREIITRCEKALIAERDFSPGESRETFRLSLDVSTQLNVLPALVRAVLSEAPGISLEVLAPRPERLMRDLQAGVIDFAITATVPPISAGIRSDFLVASEFVTILRRDHPAAPKRMTLASFLALRHVAVDLPGLADPLIDLYVKERSLARKIVLTLQTPGTLPILVSQGDSCATVPRMLLAQPQVDLASLRIYRPPIEIPPVQVSLLSHVRLADSPGHRWLQERISAVFRDLSMNLLRRSRSRARVRTRARGGGRAAGA